MKLATWLKNLSNEHRQYAKRILALGFNAPIPKGVSHHWATVIRYRLIDVIFDEPDNKSYVNQLIEVNTGSFDKFTSDMIYSVNSRSYGNYLNEYLKKKLTERGGEWNCKWPIIWNRNVQQVHPE